MVSETSKRTKEDDEEDQEEDAGLIIVRGAVAQAGVHQIVIIKDPIEEHCHVSKLVPEKTGR